MSISEQSTTQARPSSAEEVSPVVDSPAPGCLQPGTVHLLTADTALAEQHRCGYWMALCGAKLTADRLPPWECPEGCAGEHDTLICPECVRRAAELSLR